jgi:hypothetical protein
MQQSNGKLNKTAVTDEPGISIFSEFFDFRVKKKDTPKVECPSSQLSQIL